MSLDIFSQFATDESLEDNGTWFPLGGGARVLVAREGNRNYGKKLSALYERNQKALELKDDAADALSETIMIEVLATTILLGWENVSFKKAELSYSVENAKKLLAVREFRRQIAKFAADVDAYKVKEEAAQGEA